MMVEANLNAALKPPNSVVEVLMAFSSAKP